MKSKILGFLLGFVLCPVIVYAGLETGVYISDLVATNPTGSDNASTADDHMRLIKSTIKNTFPNINGAVTATQGNLNVLTGTSTTSTELGYVHGVTSAIQTQISGLATASTGSFTATLTGMSGATTGTVKYKIANGICTLYVDAIINGTSNTTAMTMTGLPGAVTPLVSTGRGVVVYGIDNNSALTYGFAVVDPVTPKITFSLTTGSFTASGTKGLDSTWTMTYPL